MNLYIPFSDVELTYLLQVWRENGINSVRIVMGTLAISLELDIYRSTIDIVVTEIDQVAAATLMWYDSRYMLFWCLYGLIRYHGLSNWEWELPNEFQNTDLSLYEEQLRLFQPYLRVKYPLVIGEAYIMENLWSNTYMKIYPVLQPFKPTATYPCGDTTIWFDSILNMNPNFCPDLQ